MLPRVFGVPLYPQPLGCVALHSSILCRPAKSTPRVRRTWLYFNAKRGDCGFRYSTLPLPTLGFGLSLPPSAHSDIRRSHYYPKQMSHGDCLSTFPPNGARVACRGGLANRGTTRVRVAWLARTDWLRLQANQWPR